MQSLRSRRFDSGAAGLRGFPVSTPDGVRLMPMAWARDAQRLAEDGYMVIVFLDELTTRSTDDADGYVAPPH